MWWLNYKERFSKELHDINNHETKICLENMQNFDGYTVPLLNPTELLKFASDNNVYITLDTMHYGYEQVNIIKAAEILRGRVKTLHLSDYSAGKYHALLGHGE